MRALREYIRLHIQDILVEGRLEDAKKKYAGRIDDQTFQLIVTNDPSGNQKYLDWACRAVAFGSDPKEVISIFKEWNKFGKNLEKKDISNLSFDEAKSTLDNYRQQLANKRKFKYESVSGANIVGENSAYILYRIMNPDAAKILGSGTKWCIASKDNEEHWDLYAGTGYGSTNSNAVYYLIPKTSSRKKIAANLDIFKIKNRHIFCISVWNDADENVDPIKNIPSDIFRMLGVDATKEIRHTFEDEIFDALKSQEDVYAASNTTKFDLLVDLLRVVEESEEVSIHDLHDALYQLDDAQKMQIMADTSISEETKEQIQNLILTKPKFFKIDMSKDFVRV
jgi:hypothetical protein